jgi:PTS system mannose-specific IIB component
MPIVLARVDNRLVHGQVLEAWAPKLEADAILAVDRDLSLDPLRRRIIEGLGMGGGPDVRVSTPEEAAKLLTGTFREQRLLILFAGVRQALEARRAGLCFECLNLGNVHPKPGSLAVTASVYLTDEDLDCLAALMAEGVFVEARAVPADRSPDIAALVEARGKA